MNMKKYVFGLTLMMGATLLTGCIKDSENSNKPYEFTITEGLLVVNNGNVANGIDGSLSFLDFVNETTQQNVYKTANGASLGGTPNDVIHYGHKIYVVGSDENTIFVLNAKTFKEIKKISTTEILGEAEGTNPRHMTAYNGRVYVSTYGGYVAEIDTVGFTMTRSFKVGSVPEGLGIGLSLDGNTAKLYVANSDYGNGNGSISIVDLGTGSVTDFKHELIRNPQEILASADVVYVLDYGYYDMNDNWLQKEAGVYMIYNNTVTKIIPDATGMAGVGNSIVTFNAPYGSSTTTYSVFNTRTGILSAFSPKGDSDRPVFSPCAIAIDANTYNVMIASRPKDPDTGYPSYAMPGYVNIYTSAGNYVGTYEAGVEPHKIEFSYGTTTLQQ